MWSHVPQVFMFRSLNEGNLWLLPQQWKNCLVSQGRKVLLSDYWGGQSRSKVRKYGDMNWYNVLIFSVEIWIISLMLRQNKNSWHHRNKVLHLPFNLTCYTLNILMKFRYIDNDITVYCCIIVLAKVNTVLITLLKESNLTKHNFTTY